MKSFVGFLAIVVAGLILCVPMPSSVATSAVPKVRYVTDVTYTLSLDTNDDVVVTLEGDDDTSPATLLGVPTGGYYVIDIREIRDFECLHSGPWIFKSTEEQQHLLDDTDLPQSPNVWPNHVFDESIFEPETNKSVCVDGCTITVYDSNRNLQDTIVVEPGGSVLVVPTLPPGWFADYGTHKNH